MHVAFVTREYPPNGMGGIGTYVVNMSDLLADAGCRVSVITQHHPACGATPPHYRVPVHPGRLDAYYLPFVHQEWKLDPRIESPETIALSRRDITAVFARQVAQFLLEFMAGDPPDVIEAPEYEAPLAHFQILRDTLPDEHPLRRSRCIVHLHTPTHIAFRHGDELLAGDWQRYRFQHERLSVRMADAVLSPSRFLADQGASWAGIPREQVTVLPYPLGRPFEGSPAAPGRSNRFLYVGRIEGRKGVFELVDAAIPVARRHPDIEFHFLGGDQPRSSIAGGSTTQQLVSAIPQDLRSRFRFRGQVDRALLGSEYAAAKFCLVPSRWENYPNTCMEAMWCGTPVLCSDQGGMAELVEHGVSGLVATPCSTRRELRDSLERTLDRAAAMDATEAAPFRIGFGKIMV